MASNFTDPWAKAMAENPIRSLSYLVVGLMIAFVYYPSHGTALTVLNPKGTFELTESRAKKLFVRNATRLMRDWFGAYPNTPASVIGDVGQVTVLPPKFANEIRNDERLSFSSFVYNAFHGQLPGFEGFKEGARDSQLVKKILTKDLTKLLNKVTEPLAAETAEAVPEAFGENPEWCTVPLRERLLHLIARISSRVFLGEELCRNEEWLAITKGYTIHAFAAAEQLRMWPKPLRYIVHWFLPSCAKARSLVKKAHLLLDPIIEKRRQQRLDGETDFNDAIEWMEKESNGDYYDPVPAQLVLSVAAVHTTSDLICQTLIRLSQHPEVLEALRREMLEVLGEGGWKKSSLYNMKLLDSVIKESQRMKPIGSVSMRRVALEDIKLSDGTVLRKNTLLSVSSHKMWDSNVYEKADEWNGHRFSEMRNIPGKEHLAQLVSTSPDHLGFGHGQHACPGRFFAANEVKIALVFLLMRYDWKLPDGEIPKVKEFGFSLATDPFMQIQVQRRQEEVEFLKSAF